MKKLLITLTGLIAVALNAFGGEAAGISSSFSPSGKYDLGSATENQPQYIYLVPAAVTQITSISTGVTLNAQSGVITTVTATTAALGSATFTVTNARCLSTSAITATVDNYSGTYSTNGTPLVNINNITNGAFDVKLLNVHTTNALNGVVKIGFNIW